MAAITFRASGRDGVEGWKPARKKSVPEFEAPHGAERTRRRRVVCLSEKDTEGWKRREIERKCQQEKRMKAHLRKCLYGQKDKSEI